MSADKPRVQKVTALVLATLVVLVAGALVPAVQGGAGGSSLPQSLLTAGDSKSTSSPEETVPSEVEQIHQDGVTGQGVTVGVIGAGFDTEDSSISDDLERTVSFKQSDDAVMTEQIRHGTAVAEVVTATAPDSKLVLAGVGESPSPAEYAAAIEWVRGQEADIIVDAGSYYPETETAAQQFETTAAQAHRGDVMFVTSAGNYGGGYWGTTVSDRGWVTFADGTEANPLTDGQLAGQVSVRLHWTGDADLGVYLYRRVPDGPDKVVVGATQCDHLATIDTTVPKGRYYVAIQTTQVAEPTDVRLYVPTHSLGYTTGENITTPVTRGADLTVGAVSSDGTQQVTSHEKALVDAPGSIKTGQTQLHGTSAAAAYVAGIAALTEGTGSVTVAMNRRLLTRTADSMGDVNQVDPSAAVESVQNLETNATASAATPSLSSHGNSEPELYSQSNRVCLQGTLREINT